MKERWFCRKKGIICPHTAIAEQVRNCAEWDPRDVICDKTCRHATSAEEKKAERERLDFLKAEHPEMLRQKPQPIIMGKDGKIDAKQTAILQRVELMQRQAEAAERIAAAQEKLAEEVERIKAAIVDIADHFGLQMAAIIDKLEPIARAFGDDEEGKA